MKRYIKEFVLRGLICGGFGPIVLAIIYAILQATEADFSPTGYEVCTAIVSIYLLAFVHAGASVFNQIEEWPLPKSLLVHFFTLFVAYSLCYIGNTWIPFEPLALAVFAAIFVVIYFVVWGIVYLCVRSAGKKMSQKL